MSWREFLPTLVGLLILNAILIQILWWEKGNTTPFWEYYLR